MQASEFFAGYLLEQSLSVDNLFVFVLLFGYFKVLRALPCCFTQQCSERVASPRLQVPKAYEAKVLEYGILGAAGLRAVFICAWRDLSGRRALLTRPTRSPVLGAVVLERFRPVLLAFAALLLFSSAKILFGGDEEEEDSMDDNAVVSLVRRLLPVSPAYDGDAFFTQVDGVRTATPLLLVLVVIELSDLVFAVDSIPAVFGVTTDPFIVYTSNMFAIAVRRLSFLAWFLPGTDVCVGQTGTSLAVPARCGRHGRAEVPRQSGVPCAGLHWRQDGCRRGF